MPQDEKSIIRSRIAPSIGLDDIILEDLFTGTSDKLPDNLKGTKTGKQMHLDVGTNYPHLTINAYTFKQAEILKFEINATGFVPKLYLKIQLIDSSTFKSHGFPKDGDILSCFIRAKNDAFKPIRNDYLVTNVMVGRGGTEGRGSTIEIFGELFIPHIHDELKRSYEGSSFEVLQKICRDLNLGFATNENSTNDEQKWICSGDTLYNFIQYVTKYSWKDDKSFFNSFIDVYYHLNFINVNNQVDGDGKLEASILDVTMMKNYYSDNNEEENSQVKSAKMLSDIDSMQGTNMYIKQYQVKNNSSAISKKWGYKSYVQFFDQKSGKPWEIFVDPIVSDGAAESKVLLKGRPFPKAPDGTAQDTYWQTQNRYFWRGIQYKDVHDKYLFAELWNERNLEELNKLYVEVDVERWNPNIYRGERIPLVLITQGDTAKRIADSTEADKQVSAADTPAVLDQFYSGYYMVDGIKFTYSMTSKSTNYVDPKPGPNPTGMVQLFTMKRREWPIPSGPPGASGVDPTTSSTGTPGVI